jgi:hypothetical protein
LERKKELISWNRKKIDEVKLISEFEEFAIVDLEKMRCVANSCRNL